MVHFCLQHYLIPFYHLQGEFIQTYRVHGYSYGLTMAAVEQAAQQGLACVSHMSIEVCQIELFINCVYIEPFPVVVVGCADAQKYSL